MAGDLFWSDVVFLCHFNGPNGTAVSSANSPDTSTIHNTLTNAGSGVTYDTSTYAFTTGSCLYNSSSNALSTGAEVGSEFQFGAGQFTIEGWFSALTPGAFFTTPSLLSCSGASANFGWKFYYSTPVTTSTLFVTDVNGADQALGFPSTTVATLGFTWSDNSTSFAGSVTGNYTLPHGTWVHLAVDRDASNVLRVYANGVVLGAATVTDTLFAVNEPLGIGVDFTGASATYLSTTSGGSFTDGSGNVYSLTGAGVAMENGSPIPGGSGTSAMDYYSSTVYAQDSATGNWFTWNGSGFTSASAPGNLPTSAATNQWDGHIDEVRITKGVARYGGTFTVPNAPFPDGPVVATGPMISIIA